MEISKPLQVAGMNPHNVHTQARAHTRAPDDGFKMTPHIGIITLFRLMTPETIRAPLL